jgi:hypothetical protein
METLTRTEWRGKAHREHWYRWVNDLENRAEGEKLRVNYRYGATYNREKGQVVYQNNWIPNKPVTQEHVRVLADYARTRLKIEHEHNNVLKNYGYHLEHHFGHGKNHACQI